MKINKIVPLTFPETNDPDPKTSMVSSLISVKLRNGIIHSIVLDHLYGKRPSIDDIFEYLLNCLELNNDGTIIR